MMSEKDIFYSNQDEFPLKWYHIYLWSFSSAQLIVIFVYAIVTLQVARSSKHIYL